MSSSYGEEGRCQVAMGRREVSSSYGEEGRCQVAMGRRVGVK